MPNEIASEPRIVGSRAFARRDIVVALLVGLLALLVYNANGRAIPAGDTYPARYLPFSILRNGSILLDPIASMVGQGRRVPAVQGKADSAFWLARNRDDHLVSLYPVALPLFVTPLYAPAVHYLERKGWDPALFDRLARVMEKLCASLIAAASVSMIYLLLRRRAAPRTALVLSIAYAFGTTTWVISSQALWMHGLAQVFVVGTMLLVTGPRAIWRVALAGCLCSLIAASRQPDAVLAFALGLFGLWWAGRRMALVFVAGGLAPAALTLAYNILVVGHVAGAYGLFDNSQHLNDDQLGGIAGLLFSPARGLFVYSPFLLFVPFFIRRAFKDPDTRLLTALIVVAVCIQVVGYAMVDWRQGMSWGPRWLTDMLPMLVWLLPPIVAPLSREGRILFATSCAAAIVIQTIGAFWYTGAGTPAAFAATGGGRMAPMWEVRNAGFIAELQHARAPHDLWRVVKGNIDVVDVVPPGGGDRTGRQIDVAGWALVDNRSPADVAVVVDGRESAGTSSFLVRPDVARAMATQSPAGWHVRLPADELRAGEHKISVLVRADEEGEPRLLGERVFSIPPTPAPEPDDDARLTAAADLAIRHLIDRQQPGGYWLTSFTGHPRFQQPHDELNTYLNAVMLDLVGPIATTPERRAMLERARSFLESQIEADGLVRYHGRPDASTIGSLGCVITPDADDTALVWRVAPDARRTRLAPALQTIARYRRPDGLYKTWFADRADYKCIDAGRDPNPADIGIQIHVLMLLAQEQPAAATQLCRALARKADEDDLWVYYASAPLMIVLRLADLEHLGCALHLSPPRLMSDVPGQDRWLRAAHLLQHLQGATITTDLYDEVSGVLQDMAVRDFELMSAAPPLLYHNDLTATVRRYYWSADVGYALWLRLDQERRRIGRDLRYWGKNVTQTGGAQ